MSCSIADSGMFYCSGIVLSILKAIKSRKTALERDLDETKPVACS